jgi:hypothetical protein
LLPCANKLSLGERKSARWEFPDANYIDLYKTCGTMLKII